MKYVEKIAPAVFIFISIALMFLFGFTAIERPLTEMEAIVLQILSLFAAFVGSYIIGRRASKDSMNEMIKPHARSAFRRLISLYNSLSRVLGIIEGKVDDAEKIGIIRAIVIEQIATANDALDDWRDVVPESVEELKQAMQFNK